MCLRAIRVYKIHNITKMDLEKVVYVESYPERAAITDLLKCITKNSSLR